MRSRPAPSKISSPCATRWKPGSARREARGWNGGRRRSVTLDEERAPGVLKLIDVLEDNDDVQNVYANFDIPEAVMQKLSAESSVARCSASIPGCASPAGGWSRRDGNRLRHIADGVIATDSDATRSRTRLKFLHDALTALLLQHRPDEAAVEETYVNRNGAATLKLGYARGVALLAPAMAGIPVAEYGAKAVKLAVVGTGGADKEQVQMMVRRLLPGAALRRADAADALAVAICHAHHRATRLRWVAGDTVMA